MSSVRAVTEIYRASEQPGGLLPQPHGFEGVPGIEVGPNPNCLAVAAVDEEADRRLGFGFASPAPGPQAAGRDESFGSQVPNLSQLDVESVKYLGHVSEQLARSRVSSVHRPLAPQPGLNPRMPLDFRVEELQHHVEVSAVVGLDRALEGLHVFLRHDLPSIAA